MMKINDLILNGKIYPFEFGQETKGHLYLVRRLSTAGMLIHETFTLINYSSDIKEIWEHSYNNRGMALNLHFHILGKKISGIDKK